MIARCSRSRARCRPTGLGNGLRSCSAASSCAGLARAASTRCCGACGCGFTRAGTAARRTRCSRRKCTTRWSGVFSPRRLAGARANSSSSISGQMSGSIRSTLPRADRCAPSPSSRSPEFSNGSGFISRPIRRPRSTSSRSHCPIATARRRSCSTTATAAARISTNRTGARRRANASASRASR